MAFVRSTMSKCAIQIADITEDQAYFERDPIRLEAAELGGYRAVLSVPMLQDNESIGAFNIYRQEPGPFSDKQITLATTFAAQAVIAIENTRLLNELRQSLEQQTATSEVLSVISSSPGELEPVFQAVLEKATRLSEANFGNLVLSDGDDVRFVAMHNPPSVYAERWRRDPVFVIRDHPRAPLARMVATKAIVHIADIKAEQAYVEHDPGVMPLADLAGARTVLAVPMVKDAELIGGIVVYRQEVRPFADRQIVLVQNFAAQAVIAIENTRLLNELRQSLEQQTATADVLRVISSSPGDLEPVFQSMLENATRICDAQFGNIYLWDGEALHLVGAYNTPAALIAARRRVPPNPPVGTPLGDMITTKRTVHGDLGTTRAYTERQPSVVDAVELGGVRTEVAVPLLKNNELLGAFVIYRQEVRPFTDKQIALVTNFAAQAVIAIENTRLLNELRQRTSDLTESLEQQTATSEVLHVISSSPGELGPVFQAMLENATRICEANFGVLNLHDNGALRVGAMHNVPPAFAEWLENQRNGYRPISGSPLDRVIRTKQFSATVDHAAEAAPGRATTLGGARSTVCVPMIKDEELVGTITIYRQEVRPFTDKQTTLLQNFAAQAVIAIENARLLNELRQRTDDLSESLEQQTATSEVLRVISSSPGQLEPVFYAMLENATRICAAEFGTLYRYDGEMFHIAAGIGMTAELSEARRQRGPFVPRPDGLLDKVTRTKQTTHTADDAAQDSMHARLGRARSRVCVPMLKDDVLVGVIGIYRQEVRPFTEKQIELLENFAAQAVIAIENTRLLNELRQSLEQQTATAEVLSVISSSPGDLKPVFQTMLESATRICQAQFGMLNLYDGSAFRNVALHNPPPQFARRLGEIIFPHPESGLAQVARTRQIAHIDDLRAGQPYLAGDKAVVDVADLGGARTVLIVPMLNEGKLIGAISIYRQEVRPFAEKQINLVKNFAAQAVIAIENTRLLNELRKSLEQQTATSEVLRVISSSPGEVQPVFRTILENASRLCEANFGILNLYDSGTFPVVAMHNVPEAFAQWRRREPLVRPGSTHTLARVAATKRLLQVTDMKAEPPYLAKEPPFVALVDDGGARTLLIVPMLKNEQLLGTISIYRQEVRPFTEKQIALLENFAAQAVIAIENARLLNELRQRTTDLAKSLEQQTATSEVLSVISSSPGDLEPVFVAMLANAVRICGANFGNIYRWSGAALHLMATHNTPPAFAEARRNSPFRPGSDTPTGRMVATKTVTHVADLAAEPHVTEQDDRDVHFGVDVGGIRTLLSVPMLKEDELVGAFTIYRQEVRPFTDKQIEFVRNFAAQAVIAIENARLLNELRQRTDDLSESLEQQTATSEVLRVISSSPGELEPVFQAMLENATRICEAKFGNLFLSTEHGFRYVAMHGVPSAYLEWGKREPAVVLGQHPHTPLAIAAQTKDVVHMADLTAERCYREGDPRIIALVETAGARTILTVPMLKDDELVGAISIYRQEVRPFSDKQIALVQNFAAQAVIAIENTRLLNELRQRTTDLTESLEQQTATSEVLKSSVHRQET